VESCELIRGDANNDGSVNLTDVIFISNLSVPPCNLDGGDVNDSGAIDLSDAIYLANHLYSGGPAPPSPYPGFGCDCTYDGLQVPSCCSPPQPFMDVVHDAGPRQFYKADTYPLAGETPFDNNPVDLLRSFNDNSCFTEPRTSAWFVVWNYSLAGGPWVEVPAQAFRSCMRVKFTLDMSFLPCISQDGGCGVFPVPGCRVNPNKLEVMLKNSVQVHFASGSETRTAFADNVSWSKTMCYSEVANPPAQSCNQYEDKNCNVATLVGLLPGAEFACSQFPFNFNKTFTVNLDFSFSEAPGGCYPATWRIFQIEIGTPQMFGMDEGLFFKFLRPDYVPDVSMLEGIFSAPATVSNVRWECQG
jgi:hypothetical protein